MPTKLGKIILMSLYTISIALLIKLMRLDNENDAGERRPCWAS
jgi:hypothetical protein